MKSKERLLILTALVALVVLFSAPVVRGEEPPAQPAPQAATEAQVAAQPALPVPDNPDVSVIKRIPKLEMYPCTDCHSNPEDFNTTPRKLTKEHLDKSVHFVKGEDERWCHNCHEEGNYLKFHLLSGKQVGLNEAYLVCAQCHSNNYKDWLHNAHGKRIGSWNGKRQIFSCPECHNPHEPPFKHLEAKKPPVRPVNNFWRL